MSGGEGGGKGTGGRGARDEEYSGREENSIVADGDKEEVKKDSGTGMCQRVIK